MFKLGLKGHFDAAHYLPGVPICCNTHGHTFRVETEIICLLTVPPNKGMILDFREIKDVWKKLDHTYLNNLYSDNGAPVFLTPGVTSNTPTAEVLAKHIFSEVKKKLKPEWKTKVSYVRVWESEDAFAEYSE